jgi:ABC-2 type transport system ATP-binding protein
MFAGYFTHPRRVPEVLELVGLAREGDRRSGKLSGGQQRRLDVALGLIGDPDLLFLDEPTTGFDPAARRQFWEVIAGLRDLGTTVLLTTHYMEEAEYLADRVAVLVRGQIVAEGPPRQLGGRERGQSRVTFRLPPGVGRDELAAFLGVDLELDGGLVTIHTDSPLPLLERLAAWCRSRGVELRDLQVARPSLEEIYLQLTSEAAV